MNKTGQTNTSVKVVQLVANFRPIFCVLRRQFLWLFKSLNSKSSHMLLKHVIRHGLNHILDIIQQPQLLVVVFGVIKVGV